MHARSLIGMLIALIGPAACRPAAPRFGPPTTVARAGATVPTVAVDEGGTTYVVWVERSPDSTLNVMLAHAHRGAAFSPAVRVNDRPGDVLSSKEEPPQVVVGPSGQLVVAWIGETPLPGSDRSDVSVRVARSRDRGATFLPPVSVWPAELGHPRADFYHDIAIGPDGRVYVSWLDLHEYADWAAARDAAHQPRRPHGADASEPLFAQLMVGESSDRGTTFGPPARLDTIACICCRSAIAASPDRAVHAMWRHVFPGSVRDFVTARAGSDSAFAPPKRVHSDGWVIDGCPDIGPGITSDDRGAIHVAWFTGAGAGAGLYYAVSRDQGATFSAPMRLRSGRAPAEAKLASLGDAAWLTWEDTRTMDPTIRFGPVGDSIGTVLASGRVPAIAAGGGVIAVAWERTGSVQVVRTP